MIKIPNPNWSQTNKNNKTGSISYSKNINLDKEGYLKLSPRSVSLFDDTENTSNIGDTDFNFPVAFGRYSNGSFRLATTDEPFNVDISNTTKSISEDAGASNPNLSFDSHGVWWQNRFYESTSTAVNYNSSGTWTSNAITGLTSGKRHYMAVFKNKQSLAVSDGNTVKLYDTSHALTTTLTIPSDYEVIGLVYNNYSLGIITRLGDDTAGQNSECFFFVWNGATSEAGSGVGTGAYTIACVIPYKASFVLVDSLGRLQYWNGGGFQTLATFPFYSEDNRWGDTLNHLSYGNNMIVDGDIILMNFGFDLGGVGKKSETFQQNNPSGIWCYDPEIGLYHRASPSISRTYTHTISQANVNTTTNIFTTSSTIPATGNVATLTSGVVGGLKFGTVYYIIKLSSTTFALAENKELAETGVKIDIISADSSQTFWLYDLIDYGTSYSQKTGAVALYDETTRAYQDCIFGGRYLGTDLNSNIYLCSNVPFLENRGYFVLPKLYMNDITNNSQKVIIKHKQLDVNDKIIVKTKNKEVLGLPTSSPNSASSDEFIWTSPNEGYTSTDLSEAKTFIDNGGDLEIEFIAGVGAGQMVKITSISYGGGIYSLVLDEDVIGASATLKSYFIVDNWTQISEINNENQDSSGVYEFQIGEISKAMEIKVELRGYNTTIEEIQIINTTNQPSK